jgi:hypothetical protein
MAQTGSACVTAVNALRASRYQKECSSATARSNGGCIAVWQEMGKVTVPSLSPGGPERLPGSWATLRDPASTTIRLTIKTVIAGILPS